VRKIKLQIAKPAMDVLRESALAVAIGGKSDIAICDAHVWLAEEFGSKITPEAVRWFDLRLPLRKLRKHIDAQASRSISTIGP